MKYLLLVGAAVLTTTGLVSSCGGSSGGNIPSNGGQGSQLNVIFSENNVVPDVERTFVNDIEETAFSTVSGRVVFELDFSLSASAADDFEISFERGIWASDQGNLTPVLTSLSSLETQRGEVILKSVRRLEFHLDDSLGIYAQFSPEGGSGLKSSYLLFDEGDISEVAYDDMVLPTFNGIDTKELRDIEDASSLNGQTVLEIRTSDFDHGIWVFDQSGITPVAMSAFTDDANSANYPVIGSSCVLQYAENSRTDFQDFPESHIGMSEAGGIYFLARLSGSACVNPRQSITQYVDGSYVELVSTGEQLPQSDTVFSSLRIMSVESDGRVYFEAFVGDPGALQAQQLYSYWLVTPTGDLRLISLEGETFDSTDSVETIAGVLKDQLTLIANIGPLQHSSAGTVAFTSIGSENKHILSGVPHASQPYSDISAPGQAAMMEAVNIESVISASGSPGDSSNQWSFESLMLDEQQQPIFVTQKTPLDDSELDEFQVWHSSSPSSMTPILTAGDPVVVNDSSHVIVDRNPFELLGVHDGILYMVIYTRFIDSFTSSSNRAIARFRLN